MQSVWKKLFCGCGSDDGSDQSKKSRSIQQNSGHYQIKKSLSRSQSEIYQSQPIITQSSVNVQLRSMNEQNYNSLELTLDNTEQMCFLIQKVHHSFQEKMPYSYKNVFDVTGDKKMKMDNIKLAPAKLSKYIAEKLKCYPRIIEVNSQFGQHSIQFIKQGIQLISFCQSAQQAKMMSENLSELQINKQQIDIIVENFGKLKLENQSKARISVDAVFLNLSHMTKKLENQIKQQLLNSFKLTSNVIILLNNSKIDFLLDQWTQIIQEHPEIWYFYVFNQSTSIALTKEEIFINQKQEFMIVYIGHSSNLNKKSLVEALYERLYQQGSSYKHYELKDIIQPILIDLVEKVGCVKIMKFFLQSLYNYNSNKGKNDKQELLNLFFAILEKEKLLTLSMLQEYSQKYPIQSNKSISPDRKQKNNTNLNQQTFSFSYDVQGDATQVTDFMIDGGTCFSANNLVGQQQ